MTQEYADNLIKYMDDTENINTLTLADLNTVLAQMVANGGNRETEEPWEDEVIINAINTSYNFCCHFYQFFIIVHEKYDLIFQNAIITVIIFVVNSPVDFVSALMDQGNDFLIFFFFIHFYRLWQAIIQSMTIPQTMLHK